MMCMGLICNSDFSRFASETRLRLYSKFSERLFKLSTLFDDYSNRSSFFDDYSNRSSFFDDYSNCPSLRRLFKPFILFDDYSNCSPFEIYIFKMKHPFFQNLGKNERPSFSKLIFKFFKKGVRVLITLIKNDVSGFDSLKPQTFNLLSKPVKSQKKDLRGSPRRSETPF